MTSGNTIIASVLSSASQSTAGPVTPAPSHSYGKIAGVLAAVAVVVVVAVAAVFWLGKRRSAPVASTISQKTVAVLPLQNIGSDKDVDFLRLALADEIATSLSYARSLSIRPFATTSKYDSPSLDLQRREGRCM